MFNICTEEASIVNLINPEQDFFQFNSFFHLSFMFVGGGFHSLALSLWVKMAVATNTLAYFIVFTCNNETFNTKGAAFTTMHLLCNLWAQ